MEIELNIDLNSFPEIEQHLLLREVKIVIWDDIIVCGYENIKFIVISISKKKILRILEEDSFYKIDSMESSQYPTVLQLSEPSGSFLLCTIETQGGQVHLICFDFRHNNEIVKNEVLKFEKSSLELLVGGETFVYSNYWMCYI
ncbi:hypothetical protein HDU92_007933 [Lobulomyces angularis]|nr:hypothetical protein HDU92_007933 [Lobulomyces angularis]